MKIKIISLIALLLFLFGVTPSLAVTYGIQTKTVHCISSALPDPSCSPGVVLTTDITKICKVGYTKTVRDVSTATKKKVFSEYDIPYSQHSNYEVDHIISLELGGSNDISNLFPESYLIKNSARVKDIFENYLHKQVCNGSITIDEAQKEISSDWLTYYTASLKAPKIKAKTVLPPPLKAEIVIPKIITAVPVIPIVQSPIVSPQIISPIISTEPAVKKSTTGICHAIGTTYYARTTNYISYLSIANCIASGGRLPK